MCFMTVVVAAADGGGGVVVIIAIFIINVFPKQIHVEYL